jgi:hypothetical protein
MKSVPFLQRAKFDAERGERDGACRAGSTSVMLFRQIHRGGSFSVCLPAVYARLSYARLEPSRVLRPLSILHQPSSSLPVASSLL